MKRIRRIRQWLKHRPASLQPTAADRAIASDFLDSAAPDEARYEALFRYFRDGFMAEATPDFERIHYRGRGSVYGYAVTGLEGFARTAPLLAAWIAAGREGSEALIGPLVSALSAGSDPAHPAFWTEPRRRHQLIVESADIAITLWIGRDTIWPRLDSRVRGNLIAWLRKAASVEPYPNNWLLFGVVVEAALDALDGRPLGSSPAYDRFKRFYLGHGWFSDDEQKRVVDFYNPWGITYPLFWIHRMQPGFDPDFLRQVVLDSADLTAHLISPRGIPIMGRSVCYRTAVPTPLVLATWVDPSPERLGVARRGLDCVWRYFVANGALRDGTLTQGYFHDDPRVLDNYSGPGSSHWGLRSLIPALLDPAESAFWTAPATPLPIERGDYRLDLPELGWRIDGDATNGDIRITIPSNAGNDPRLRPFTLGRRLSEYLQGRPRRPNNHAAAYEAEVYTALAPYPLRP
jgi:hypothetical protein